MGKTKEKNKAGRVLLLPVDQIEASPYQARTSFDDTEIAALAVSILQNGLLQPVSVRRTGVHKYQLVAGERRLRACRLAKLEKVPAILAEFNDSESAALGLLENLQRAQLDPFDTARGIREVIRLWGCTQAEAARRLGLSQSALANKLRLLTLTADQQRLCAASHLSERHARAALRLPENRRTAALEKMARDGLSVREADKLVDAMLAAPKAGPSPVRRTVPMVRDVRFFVNTLQHAVDMMAQKGIPATATCGRRDGCLEYTVRIPVGETAGPDAFAVVPVPLPHAGAPRTPHLPSAAGADPAGDRAAVVGVTDPAAPRDGTAAARTAVDGAADLAGADVAAALAGAMSATPAAGVGTTAPAAAMSAAPITPAPSPEVPSPAEPAALAENADTPDLTPCAALP
ncbi:MAG: ParB/RepB/Spo0J family partition protein [Gemmiger sp.]